MMKEQWWHDKVAYQIYPKSFYDSNGDGIGDIPGIIDKLDYLKYLGIDIIWISPVYESPQADQGYDISDYYKIDPVFGTMDDMDRLLSEAKKRDLYILMDLVANHCSDEHEWFLKAKEDPEGEYGNFFYLADQKDGIPCNWRSYFGGSVWEPMEGTDKYYLHLFHKKQPDLNWENPRVREEIYKIINWWLDKGLAGFRIDAIINIKKPLPFKDYPADRDDGMVDHTTVLDNAEGIGVFLEEMKEKTFSRYGAFTVAELFNEKPEELEDYIGDDGYFSSIFDFNEHLIGLNPNGAYLDADVTPEEYKKAVFDAQRRSADIGFYSNIIENHDEARGVSRYLPAGAGEAAKKMLAGLYFMLRGLPFIYQGQEIGMENEVVSSIDEVDDVITRAEYETALDAGIEPDRALQLVMRNSRDNSRTPMQWDGSDNAGFTTGTPWLKTNPDYHFINVDEQLSRDDSLLNFYRTLIAIRKDERYKGTLVYGSLTPYLEEQKDLMAYLRSGEDMTLLIIGNYQADPQTADLPSDVKSIILNNFEDADIRERTVFLKGWQYLILELEIS